MLIDDKFRVLSNLDHFVVYKFKNIKGCLVYYFWGGHLKGGQNGGSLGQVMAHCLT